MSETNKKTTFSDLSGGLKTAIILAWVCGVIFSLAFIVGFLGAIITP